MAMKDSDPLFLVLYRFAEGEAEGHRNQQQGNHFQQYW